MSMTTICMGELNVRLWRGARFFGMGVLCCAQTGQVDTTPGQTSSALANRTYMYCSISVGLLPLVTLLLEV